MAETSLGPPDDPVAVELALLRRARGLRRSRLAPTVGPELRALLDVAPDAGDQAIRQPLTNALLLAANTLEPDLQLVFLYALAVRSDQRLLQDRLAEAGQAIERDSRTVRRRLDEANLKVADHLRAQQARRRGHPTAPTGWSVVAMTSELDLRPTRPRMTAVKTILAAKRLRELTESFYLEGPERDRDGFADMTIEVSGGAQLRQVEQVGRRSWRYRIRLSTQLEPGDRHTFQVTVTVPSRENAAPFNVVAPLRECESFSCIVHFSPDQIPTRIQRIDGLPTSAVNDAIGSTDLVPPALQVADRFTSLTPGLAYGLRWVF